MTAWQRTGGSNWATVSHDEPGQMACKVFELSQTPRERWVAADYDAKRRILEIVCLNLKLNGGTLIAKTREPFDACVEGLS